LVQLGRFIAVGGRRLAPAGRPPADAEQACGPIFLNNGAIKNFFFQNLNI
jgi:hypothetical protein